MSRSQNIPGGAGESAATGDPTWSDTWAVVAVDPVNRQGVYAHVLANARTGQTRHALILASGGRTWRSETVTSGDPLSSDLLEIELDGWEGMSVRAPGDDVTLDATSSHAAIDFAGEPDVTSALRQSHQETGVTMQGRIGGTPFTGAGLRDRSSGPRSVSGAAAHAVVAMSSLDGRLSFSVNALHLAGTPLGEPPDVVFGFVADGGPATPLGPEDIGISRSPDGAVASVRIGDRTVMVTDVVGTHTNSTTWRPDDPREPAERRVYMTFVQLRAGTSQGVGALGGCVEQGVLAWG